MCLIVELSNFGFGLGERVRPLTRRRPELWTTEADITVTNTNTLKQLSKYLSIYTTVPTHADMLGIFQ